MKHPDESKLREIQKREQERLSEIKQIQKREQERLAEAKELFKQEFQGRLQEIRYLQRQQMKYLKKLDLTDLKKRHLKKLTILHSNDLHGDFLAEDLDSGLVGGVSMLSGYVNKVRNDEENVLYAIAGDMLRGSLIDSEFKGISTIEIMNLLAPDVVTLGNHEADYGMAHMLFIEKCAAFPIINANMYLTLNGTRLFNSHIIINVGGIRILFIGIITEDVLPTAKNEGLIGTLIDISDAAEEISKVTDAYKTSDVDLTVLLTHIGFEEDKQLAAALDPGCAVDIIIGGHSHTYLEEPCEVNGIPIVQAAVGTAQIGRFDIIFDEWNNRIDSYTWQLIPITEDNCPRDEALEEVINKYKEQTDSKYGRILTRFPRAYTHPYRNMETELGDLLSEIMREQLGVDLVLLGSGSIRKESLGPIVTLKDFMEIFPFTDPMIGFNVRGDQLRQLVRFLMREEEFTDGDHCEWFQFSRYFFCEYDRGTREILKLTMNGKDVEDSDVFRVAAQSYFYLNMNEFLGVSLEEIEKNGQPAELAVKAPNVLEEYFSNHDYIKLDGEPRLLIHDPA